MLELVPYQEADIDEELRAACEEAMHVIKADGEIVKGGVAVVFTFEQLGWKTATLWRVPPFNLVREPAYRYMATHRLQFARWFFRPEKEG